MPEPTRFLGRLKDKVAVVTGAGTEGEGFGIGKAIAYWFACEGAKVCLVDMDIKRADETRQLIARNGGEAISVEGDVANENDDVQVIQQTIDQWGRLDILVNNVGIARGGADLESLDLPAWQRVFDVNLKSALILSKYAVPHMITSRGGSIINISSIGGLRAHGNVAYGPSKAALIALTRELSIMYGRKNVRSNAIAPGHIYTPMAMRHVGEEAREFRRKVAPLGIEGDSWDVAALAVFLASDESRFITSACIPVDGGLTEMAPLVGMSFANE